jgi:hypothetical protein
MDVLEVFEQEAMTIIPIAMARREGVILSIKGVLCKTTLTHFPIGLNYVVGGILCRDGGNRLILGRQFNPLKSTGTSLLTPGSCIVTP